MSSNRFKFNFFAGFAALLFIMGVVLAQDFNSTMQGLKIIITHPSLLDFDSFYFAGNLASPFINVSLILATLLFIIKICKVEITGEIVATILTVVGFAFYGKNILNICFPMLGVLIHTKLTGHKVADRAALMFLSTSLGPVFSVLAFGTEPLNPGSMTAILVGIVVSLSTGIFTAVLALYVPKFHRGLFLYNTGFAAGLATTAVNAMLIALGLGHERYPYADSYITGQNTKMMLLLLVPFGYFILTGLLTGGAKNFKKLFWHSSGISDYTADFGFPAALINIGVVGLLMIVYIQFISRGDINGTAFAAIFTAAGFAVYGSTIRTHLPVMFGVFLGAFVSGGIAAFIIGEPFVAAGFAKVAVRGMVLSAIYSCGVAPVSHEYGVLAGIFLGVMNSFVAPHVSQLHGWMSMYNNGFALGLMVTFLYPVFSRFPRKSEVTLKVNVKA